jgi:RimJ/RimL family protein N-acetyltransferase
MQTLTPRKMPIWPSPPDAIRRKVLTERASRVRLRPLEADDITEDYVAWFRDVQVTHYLDSTGFSKADALEYLETGRATRSHFMHAIVDKASGLHIGNIKLGPINWRHGLSDLVTVIGRREFWGQGYATDAIRAGNRMAFQEYGFRKLSGGIAEGNEGSLKAYMRAGWVVEGRLKGHHLIGGVPRDRIMVSCFNPAFFPQA